MSERRLTEVEEEHAREIDRLNARHEHERQELIADYSEQLNEKEHEVTRLRVKLSNAKARTRQDVAEELKGCVHINGETLRIGI